MERGLLPAGCSDLIEAYELRSELAQDRSRMLLRISALMHDAFLERVDLREIEVRGAEYLIPEISNFLHPLLLANPRLEKLIGSSSDLVATMYDVVMANLEGG